MSKILNFKKILSSFLLFAMIFSFSNNIVFAEEKTSTSKGPNIEIIENTNEEFTKLKEKSRLLIDENNRLREELRKLNAKVKNDKNAKDIPVLMYHHILKQSDIVKHNWQNNASVLSLEAFEEQMKYLYDNDFYVASLEELELFIDGKLSLPEKTVAITFDDGYLSNAIYAYPILQKYNFRATIFMIGYRVDGPQINFNPNDTQALSVKETSKYTDVFDFQSHTYNMHNINSQQSAALIAESDSNVKKDLLKNKNLLNAKYLAYPYGKFNEKVVSLVQETGHRLGFTIDKGFVTTETHKFKIPRNGVSQTVTLQQFVDLVNANSIVDNKVDAQEIKTNSNSVNK